MSEPYSVGIVGFGQLGRAVASRLTTSEQAAARTIYVSSLHPENLEALVARIPKRNSTKIIPCTGDYGEARLLKDSKVIVFSLCALGPPSNGLIEKIKQKREYLESYTYTPYQENVSALTQKARVLRSFPQEDLADKLFIITSNPPDLLAEAFWKANGGLIAPDQVIGLNPETYLLQNYADFIAYRLKASGIPSVLGDDLRESLIIGEHALGNQFVAFPHHFNHLTIDQGIQTALKTLPETPRLEKSKNPQNPLTEFHDKISYFICREICLLQLNHLQEHREYLPEIAQLVYEMIDECFVPKGRTFVSSTAT